MNIDKNFMPADDLHQVVCFCVYWLLQDMLL